MQEKVGLIAPEKIYDWDALRCRGEALLAANRAKDALAPLARSLTLPPRGFAWDRPPARFARARATLDANGDRDQAFALAREARAELLALPYATGFLPAVDGWLADHDREVRRGALR